MSVCRREEMGMVTKLRLLYGSIPLTFSGLWFSSLYANMSSLSEQNFKKLCILTVEALKQE